MVYYPNIPQSGDRPSQSQAQILSNFSDLDTVFNDNHIGFSQPEDRGEHRKVTFNDVIADPGDPDPKATLYIKTIAGDSELFFENYDNAAVANLVRQLTGIVPVNVGTDYSIDSPWGLQFRFGTFLGNAGGVAVAFAAPFTTAAYCIVLTASSTTARMTSYAGLGVAGFTGYVNFPSTVSYIAFGY